VLTATKELNIPPRITSPSSVHEARLCDVQLYFSIYSQAMQIKKQISGAAPSFWRNPRLKNGGRKAEGGRQRAGEGASGAVCRPQSGSDSHTFFNPKQGQAGDMPNGRR
jgi:hypothetical protein